MSQFYREIKDLDVEPIKKLLAANPTPFKPSQIYSSAKGEKFVDDAIRKSSYRSLADKDVLDAAEMLVAQAAESDDLHEWRLFRNDVTQIRYG